MVEGKQEADRAFYLMAPSLDISYKLNILALIAFLRLRKFLRFVIIQVCGQVES